MSDNIKVLKNESFTTIDFRVCFQIKLKTGDSALSILVPRLLVWINEKYPSEEEFKKGKLIRNISGFGYYYYKFGDTICIQFSMKLIDPKYIGEDKIEEAFELLMDTIYKPKLDGNKFDEKLYEKEFEKLREQVDSSNKNIKSYSYSMALKAVDDLGYIKNDVFIDNTLLDNVTNEKLYSYYKENIFSVEPTIFVLGDIDNQVVEELYDKYGMKNTKKIDLKQNYNKFLIKKDNEIREIEEEKYFNQSALITVYKIDDIKEEDKIMMFAVLCLLSSASSSLLKKKLRLDAGLVYTPYSYCEYFDGLLSVMALISSEAKEQALKQIGLAFDDIQKEEVIKPLLENIVDRCRLNLIYHLDEKVEVMNDFVNDILGFDFTDQQKYDKLKGIKASEVAKFAKRIKLDLIYFLRGVENGK